MIVAPGPSLITFRGRQLVRRHAFVNPMEIVCPDGHRVKPGAMTITESAGLTCLHRPGGQGECGAIMWLLYLPAPSHRSLFYVADVERRELDAWARGRFAMEDVLRYVGAWL